MSEAAVQQQVRLPFRKAVKIAWKNIRVRWWRSMVVTGGIILALAFLSYVLASAAIKGSVSANASAQLRQEMQKRGTPLLGGTDGDAAAAASRRIEELQTWWMVGLALLVSFVGILNAMLMSVTERFAEIGTMKCLGALDGFIVKLFLLESTFQGVSGTAIGIVIGLLLASLEALLTYGGEALTLLPAAQLGQYVGMCLVAGTLLTVLAGLYPAWRAAKMQPVDAMRTEV